VHLLDLLVLQVRWGCAEEVRLIKGEGGEEGGRWEELVSSCARKCCSRLRGWWTYNEADGLARLVRALVAGLELLVPGRERR